MVIAMVVYRGEKTLVVEWFIDMIIMIHTIISSDSAALSDAGQCRLLCTNDLLIWLLWLIESLVAIVPQPLTLSSAVSCAAMTYWYDYYDWLIPRIISSDSAAAASDAGQRRRGDAGGVYYVFAEIFAVGSEA